MITLMVILKKTFSDSFIQEFIIILIFQGYSYKLYEVYFDVIPMPF